MVAAYPDKVGKVLSVECGSVEEVLEAERQALGLDHCEAGWWLARAWSLPELIMDVSRHHHSPQNGNGGVLPLVAFSCRLADVLGYPAAACRQSENAEGLTECPLYGELVPEAGIESLAEKVKHALTLFG
jgi:hypothetical protein